MIIKYEDMVVAILTVTSTAVLATHPVIIILHCSGLHADQFRGPI